MRGCNNRDWGRVITGVWLVRNFCRGVCRYLKSGGKGTSERQGTDPKCLNKFFFFFFCYFVSIYVCVSFRLSFGAQIPPVH